MKTKSMTIELTDGTVMRLECDTWRNSGIFITFWKKSPPADPDEFIYAVAERMVQSFGFTAPSISKTTEVGAAA